MPFIILGDELVDQGVPVSRGPQAGNGVKELAEFLNCGRFRQFSHDAPFVQDHGVVQIGMACMGAAERAEHV